MGTERTRCSETRFAKTVSGQPALVPPSVGESSLNENMDDVINEEDIEEFLHDVGLLDETEELDLDAFN